MIIIHVYVKLHVFIKLILKWKIEKILLEIYKNLKKQS